MPQAVPPNTLTLVTKPHGHLVPKVLAQVATDFLGRGWAIHGDGPAAQAWSDAGLPPGGLNPSAGQRATLALVLGGDGTMLRAAREVGFSGTPLLGINLGSLGFLTAHPAEHGLASVRKYFAGGLVEDRRCALHVGIRRGGAELASWEVLNDAVIAKGALSRMLKLDLCIDGGLAAHIKSDGLIVATPTGSTAYALAAGGPIVHPTLRAWTIAPICPHSLNMRPCAIPANMPVTVALGDAEEAHLTLDGQVGCPLLPGDVIEMRDAGGHVTILQDPDMPFFALLRQKMHWSEE